MGDHVGVDGEDAGVPRPHPRQARRAQLLHPARQVRRVALARFRSIFIIYILLTMYNLLLFMKSNHKITLQVWITWTDVRLSTLAAAETEVK